MSRLEKIREMLQHEPDDVFLRYALAMELDSAGRGDESLALYAELMRGAPPHVPSFFRTAQILARQGKTARVIETLQQGIRQAQAQGDPHTAMEMSQMLEEQQHADDEP